MQRIYGIRPRCCFARQRCRGTLSDVLFAGRKLTHVAQGVWREVVREGDSVVDATCGNGYDALCLARLVEAKGRLVCFDVQLQAIDATRSRLEDDMGYSFEKRSEEILDGASPEGPSVELRNQSHSTIGDVVEAGVKLVCFNLGYLPSGDKRVTTQTSSTLDALHGATRLLLPTGVISVMSYPGHTHGRHESDHVRRFASELSKNEWLTLELQIPNRHNAPILTILHKN